jgi:D-alanine-D-alanine ligase
MKILVLGGGDSPEREVSLRSAKSVAEAARHAGYKVTEADPKNGLKALDEASKDTIVFPILHGKNGEDGVIQKALESRKLPFLGTYSQPSADCFDKWVTHQKLEAAGLPMPGAALVSKENYLHEPMAKDPHVLKILHGGSSIGTLKIAYPEPPPLKNIRIDNLFKLENQAIVEKLIEGTEITVPVLDQTALPVVEILPPENEEFDYVNKYNGRTQEICPPKSVSQELQTQARQLAEKVHKIMGCRHLSRVDFMIDQQNKLYILEVNTMPGLTEQSLYPKSAAAAGITMPDLVNRFVELMKRDYSI